MEENKYSKSKIYKLVPKVYEGEFIPYYGSTIENYISKRLQKHKLNYKNYLNGLKYYSTSFEVFKNHGIDNVDIILVENYPCNSKEELEAKERYYIENNICVNKLIPVSKD